MFDAEVTNHVFLDPIGYEIENKIVTNEEKTQIYTHIQDDVAFWKEPDLEKERR